MPRTALRAGARGARGAPGNASEPVPAADGLARGQPPPSPRRRAGSALRRACAGLPSRVPCAGGRRSAGRVRRRPRRALRGAGAARLRSRNAPLRAGLGPPDAAARGAPGLPKGPGRRGPNGRGRSLDSALPGPPAPARPPRPSLRAPRRYLRPSQPAPWLLPPPRPKAPAARPFPPLAGAWRVAPRWGLAETRARGGVSCRTPAHCASERDGPGHNRRGRALTRML